MGTGLTAGYRDVMGHPVARRLWLATAISVLGDFVGRGALLVLAFERSGGDVLAPASVMAVSALPALGVGVLGGGWLDTLHRGRALAAAQLVGAAAVLVAVAVPGLVGVLVAAALLGAVTAGTGAIRSGAIGDGVPDELRGPLVALLGATDQTSQVVGFLTGATVAVVAGATPALLADGVSFVLAAVLLSGIPFPRRTPQGARQPIGSGWRTVRHDPLLRLLLPMVAVSATVGALPESLAQDATRDAPLWTGWVMAAGPAGVALGALGVGGFDVLARPRWMLFHLGCYAMTFLLVIVSGHPAALALTNLLVGVGAAWMVGPQTVFVRRVPSHRLAQVTGLMIAVVIVAEGVGTFVLGFVASRGGLAAAYLVAGGLLGATVLVALPSFLAQRWATGAVPAGPVGEPALADT